MTCLQLSGGGKSLCLLCHGFKTIPFSQFLLRAKDKDSTVLTFLSHWVVLLTENLICRTSLWILGYVFGLVQGVADSLCYWEKTTT